MLAETFGELTPVGGDEETPTCSTAPRMLQTGQNANPEKGPEDLEEPRACGVLFEDPRSRMKTELVRLRSGQSRGVPMAGRGRSVKP